MKTQEIYRWNDAYLDIARIITTSGKNISIKEYEICSDGEILETKLDKESEINFINDKTNWILVEDVAKSESSIIQPAPKIKVTRARSLCYFKSNNGKSTQEYNQYNEPTANTYECPIVISYAS